jgi:hypothetical protein
VAAAKTTIAAVTATLDRNKAVRLISPLQALPAQPTTLMIPLREADSHFPLIIDVAGRAFVVQA